MQATVSSRRVFQIVASFLCLTPLIMGCGGESGETAEGRTKPQGRILNNGLPVEVDTHNLPPGDPGMQVTFIKIDSADAGAEHVAQIIDASQGTFEVIGADGKGIPTGKYRVAIVMAPVGGKDVFQGKYSRKKSPIEIDVQEGADVVIDIADHEKPGD